MKCGFHRTYFLPRIQGAHPSTNSFFNMPDKQGSKLPTQTAHHFLRHILFYNFLP